MLKKLSPTLLLLTLALGLSGCSFFYESVEPASKTQTCVQLKRQLIYYNNNRNTEAAWVTPAQKQELMLKLKENHCDD